VAASEAVPEMFKLLFKYPQNRADVNSVTKEGLNGIHILMAQLIDLANLDNKPVELRGSNPPTDEDIEHREDAIFHKFGSFFACLVSVARQALSKSFSLHYLTRSVRPFKQNPGSS
jgi:hypothetical protein